MRGWMAGLAVAVGMVTGAVAQEVRIKDPQIVVAAMKLMSTLKDACNVKVEPGRMAALYESVPEYVRSDLKNVGDLEFKTRLARSLAKLTPEIGCQELRVLFGPSGVIAPGLIEE